MTLSSTRLPAAGLDPLATWQSDRRSKGFELADESALIRAFADYARTISRAYEIGDVLYRLTDQVVEILEVDAAGVSLHEGGELSFVTATDERVLRLEERQAEVADGPCYEAYRSGDRATSADLRAEPRWPGYTSVAEALGCRSVAGIPMRAGDVTIGALNLYRYTPGEWPANELEIAQVLADMASGYVVNARVLSATQQLANQLQHALDSRIVIEQAKGILAGRTGQNPEDAFADLRSFARNHGRKLHDVAREIIEGTLTL